MSKPVEKLPMPTGLLDHEVDFTVVSEKNSILNMKRPPTSDLNTPTAIDSDDERSISTEDSPEDLMKKRPPLKLSKSVGPSVFDYSVSTSPKKLEDLDRELEKLHNLTEDVFQQASKRDAERAGTEAIWINVNTGNDSLLGQASDMEDEDVAEEVEEAIREAEELYQHMHVDDTDDDSTSRKNDAKWSGPATRKNLRPRVSSFDLHSPSIYHGRARSTDSRARSFMSSVTSFRRPSSHLSVDNSCFELSDPRVHEEFYRQPIEKLVVKSASSAPEMRLHDIVSTNSSSFVSSPCPSNYAPTTTSDPSVADDISVDNAPTAATATSNFLLPPPMVTHLKLNEGLKAKQEEVKKTIDIDATSKLHMSSSTPALQRYEIAREDETLNFLLEDNQQDRTIESVLVQIDVLELTRKIKKPIYILAKLDTHDAHKSHKIDLISANPLHEFTVESRKSFNFLHIVFLEGSRTKVARPIGKISIRHSDLAFAKGKTHNQALSAVSKYPEFCGQICVDIKRRQGFFSIRVVDCGGLELKESIKLLLLVSTLERPNEVGKLYVQPDRRSREWLEMPCCEGLLSLKMTLWQDLLKGVNSVFNGQVRVDVDEKWVSGPAKWFYLRSRATDQRENVEDASDEKIGDCTLKTTHQVDHVLRYQVYSPLMNQLVASSSVAPMSASLVSVIECLPKVELGQLARSLVELLATSHKLRPILKTLYQNSISKCQDENTLFRGQSLAGKMLFEVMASYGRNYLQTTLQPLMDKIYKERKNCEVDPSRITPGNTLEKNKANLLAYFAQVFDRITSSSNKCPHFIKLLLADLREIVSKKTGRVELERLALSSFIVMRFFAAAVLNPKAFDIRKDQPDNRVSRTLLLLSKMLQRVANCTVSERQLSVKEPWLAEVLTNVTDDKHKNAMSEFLDKVSLVGESNEPEQVTVFKCGVLRQIDHTKSGLKKILQTKKRFVKLTDADVIWQKDSLSPPKGSVSLSEVKMVTADEKHVITLHLERTHLKFEAGNLLQAQEWVAAIEKCRSRVFREICEVPEEGSFDVESHLDKIHMILYKHRDTIVEWIEMLKASDFHKDDGKLRPEIILVDYIKNDERDGHRTTLQKTLENALVITDAIHEAHIEYASKHKIRDHLEQVFDDPPPLHI